MDTNRRTHCRRGWRPRRRGNILVLSAVLMVMTVAFVAFAVDLGSLYVARGELQRAADAAALSATWELVDQNAIALNTNYDTLRNNARSKASQYAAYNPVLSRSLSVTTADIEVGYISEPSDPSSPLNTVSTNAPNAVRVTARKTALRNDPVSFGFARVLGIFSQDVETQSTAALITNLSGFQTPGDQGNVGILPIALDVDTFNLFLGGVGTDNWRWDETTQSIAAGADGIREMNLYPQGTGSPGNRGTVDIGSSNNSTADISRQILHGVTPADLAHHGGELKFDSNGKLFLNGDTGISAGIKDDLEAIKGQPRTIPIFSQVVGPGNNATYTIVKFIGIRILEVKLTGSQSSKRVIIQPATMIARGGIPSSTPGQSYYVYSPPWLCR